MIVILLLFCLVLYIAIRDPIWVNNFPDIHKIQKEIHQYSGLNKSLYMLYLDEMDKVMGDIGDTQMAAGSLYIALEHMRSAGLNVPGGDSEIPDIINKLCDELGKVTEKYIMKYALQNGNRFNPRYLNDMFINIKE